MAKEKRKINGFVDKVEGDIAYVSLFPKSGKTIYTTLPTEELTSKGVTRRFVLTMGKHFSVEPLPDIEISPEREKEIDEQIRKAIGDDDAPQNDY